MYTIDWSPKAVEKQEIQEDGSYKAVAVPPVLEGVVKLKVPKHQDRMRALRAITSKIVEGQLQAATESDKLETVIAFAKAHVESVDLTRVEDGFKLNTFEMLEYDKDGYQIIDQVAGHLIKGISLGKN